MSSVDGEEMPSLIVYDVKNADEVSTMMMVSMIVDQTWLFAMILFSVGVSRLMNI